MARPESVALAGYFPTPVHLIPLIAKHVGVPENTHSLFAADPCAGDGEALEALANALDCFTRLYTCELETTRHKALVKRFERDWNKSQFALCGDAFQLEISHSQHLLFLNPPYDIDPVHGRLEQRFLERFTNCLTNEGLLVFLVPHYALAASAETLALEYDNVQCFKFPAGDFEAFKQVVVFANRCERRLAPDANILALVEKWTRDVSKCRVLGSVTESHGVPSVSTYATWRMREVDYTTLAKKNRPWRRNQGTSKLALVPHVLPDLPVDEILCRQYPIATAPRPAHIGAGIAAGIFNGQQVTSETKGLPPLLVKGVFTRDYRTVQKHTDKDGQVTSVTQVQAPKLMTTVLNLKTFQYQTLKGSGEGSRDSLQDFSIDGLLEHYGPSLMNVMLEQCPVIYDPARDGKKIKLAKIARPLYRAQEHAAKALIQLLGGTEATRAQRQGKGEILLGEIGTGKTAPALNVACTISKRALVFCPPHLLRHWEQETAKVTPNAIFRTITSLDDVDAVAQLDVPEGKFLLAVVSRETAKLGHGWESVSGLGCPKCGAPLPEGVDLAKKRICCEAHPLSLLDGLAQAAYALALRVGPCSPHNGNVRALLDGRHQTRILERAKEHQSEWDGFDTLWVDATIRAVTEDLVDNYNDLRAKLLVQLLLADYQAERIAKVALELHAAGQKGSWMYEDLARKLTCLLEPESELQNDVAAVTYASTSMWNHANISTDIKTLREAGLHCREGGKLKLVGRKGFTLNDERPGSLELAKSILSTLCVVGRFSRAEEPCGEPLYQAAGTNRYPVSKYIVKKYPKLFDLLLLDEGHEYSNPDSAQSHAAHRLTALGIPTILMTGSLMNGYASSLFVNMWALSPSFREEFERDEIARYVARYGYSKRVLTEKDMETKEVVEFGSNSDRVTRSARAAGQAPGILPLFLFRHLLQIAVTLHKADLGLELPPCHHETVLIEPDKTLMSRYSKLQKALVARIKKDRYSEEGLSGKLFGALSELPSFLDRATSDTGNQDDGSYQIRYPESVGGELVVAAEPIDSKKITPKEQWLIDKIRDEIAEDRNVLVFGWHVDGNSVLKRLARVIERELKIKAPIIDVRKIPTHSRQDWIDKHIVEKNARVAIANPSGIQTGLNNLVHFSTIVYMENPGCHPQIYRQSTGRIDRVGKTKESRVFFPIYKDTLQAQLHQLLMQKVAVSTSTDGLDAESVLLAAGAGDDAMLMGLSIGRQLWELINNQN